MEDGLRVHDANTCPNKILIDRLVGDVRELRDDMHEMDKDLAIKNTKLDVQYSTIIDMLAGSSKSRDTLIAKVGELEEKLVVNEHITNQTADAFSRITWGLVGRLGTLFGAAGVVIAWIVSIWKG